jgi:hypothetical protein
MGNVDEPVVKRASWSPEVPASLSYSSPLQRTDDEVRHVEPAPYDHEQ